MEKQNNKMEKLNNKIWVISFIDVVEEFWKIEIYDNNGFKGYGKVKTFKTKKECENFIINSTDTQAYNFIAKQITIKELNEFKLNSLLRQFSVKRIN